MAELDIMNLNTLNSNQSSSYFDLKLVSVNIRSLRKHMVYRIKEPHIMQSDVIISSANMLET